MPTFEKMENTVGFTFANAKENVWFIKNPKSKDLIIFAALNGDTSGADFALKRSKLPGCNKKNDRTQHVVDWSNINAPRGTYLF